MNVVLTTEQIHRRVGELGRQIAQDHRGQPVTIVGVMTGSLFFLADLVRAMDIPVRIGLVRASSYRGDATTPGELHIGAELVPDVRGRHVLLLDDILDTGNTVHRLIDHLARLDPLSVKVVVLLRKLGRQVIEIEPDYTGFEIPEAFVVGYGLDWNDEYRHLPYIAELSSASRAP
jgi:hypoxanthine phosphoribosyltransferase